MWDIPNIYTDVDKDLLITNKIGAINLKELNIRERRITLKKENALSINPIKGNFDYQHLKDIHKYIFEDIYTWAGQDRFDMKLFGFMSKDRSLFCAGGYIPEESKKIFSNLKNQNYFKNYSNIDQFVKDISSFVADLNALHPFREGNGRTQRVFLNQLVQNTNYKIDFNFIPKDKFVKALIEAMHKDNKKLEDLIKENIKELDKNISEQKQNIKTNYQPKSKIKTNNKDIER